MGILLFLCRIAIQAVSSYIIPAVLIAVGVPLDRWAIAMSEFVAGIEIPSGDALYVIALVFFIVLSIIEMRWKPIGRLLERLRPRKTPEHDWVAIADAPFVLPKHEDIGKSGHFDQEAILINALAGGSINKKPNPPGMKFNPARPVLRSKNGADMVFCGIEWDTGKFVWRWATPLESEPDRKFGIKVYPWNAESLTRTSSFLLDESAINELINNTKSTWRDMTYPILNMIKDCELHVWARYGSAAAPFSQISPDVWRHFKITDWPNGQAKNDGGESLYSIHVEIVRPSITSRIWRRVASR